MVKIPSAASVPSIAPPAAPNVMSDARDFGIAENLALAGAGNASFDAGMRVVRREDAISRANSMGRVRTALDDQMQRFTTETDEQGQPLILQPDAGQQFSATLDKTIQDELAAYRGSPAGLQTLRERLLDVKAQYSGAMAGNIITEQRAAVDGYLESEVSSLLPVAQNDPQAFQQHFDTWDAIVDETGGAYSPSEEEARRKGGKSALALGMVDSYLNQGNFEGLDAFVATPEVAAVLSPQDMRRINDAKGAANAQVSKITNWVAGMRAQGIEPSRQEIMQMAGGYVAPPPVTNINVGTPQGPLLSKDQQSIIMPDPSEPSGYRQVPIGGSEADQAIEATDTAALRKLETSQQLLDVFTTNTNRIFDIVEESGGGLGPIEGRVGQYNPFAAANRIEPFLGPMKSGVVRKTMEDMRAGSVAGATGFGALSERELKVVEDAAGALETSMEERDFFNNLTTIVEGQAKAAYGTDQEIDLAVGQGKLTAAEGAAYELARNRVVSNFKARANNVLQTVEGRQEFFDNTVREVQRNPQQFTLDVVRDMLPNLTQEQGERLIDVYDAATAGADPEIVEFVAKVPDARQYAQQMADLLEAGQANTLEEAYRMAKGGGGG